MSSRLLSLDIVSILDDVYRRYLLPYERLIVVFWISAFIAYGFIALNHTIAGDDWGSFQSSHFEYIAELEIGRWTRPLIWTVLADKLGSHIHCSTICTSRNALISISSSSYWSC